MRIFITGGSGCIGHYIADLLIQNTEHELFFLVRNPSKLKFNYLHRTGVNIIEGDLSHILDYQELLSTINIAILTATCWGGEEESYQINVEANINLINSLNPDNCQQIIYFSTASILNQDNQLLHQAGEIGTDYIKTKYQCYTKLSELPLFDRIITVYPTLVFGGEENKPYSHLSAGLKDLPKLINLIRWFQADGSFHFIHAQDIATMIVYLIENRANLDSSYEQKFVLANPSLKVNEAIQEISNYFGKKVYFQIPLSILLANVFIKVFNVQMAEWDYFCLNYRHFVHKKFVNPHTFNLQSFAPNLTSLLDVSLKNSQ
ncbi:NAD-dependent epimerase/dehydratase family protein [Geminocystis sp. CENA526]|uniref:NAD-dependent epimerase/dehydratase family protein n=1 Tax=Geminocystis sp. CENA526 TaxID=1355871 RepID=UPI003D6E2C36